MVQGVLAQSMKMKHWLTPSSLIITSISAAGLGVVAAAGIQNKKKRLVIVITGCAALTTFSFQWTISSKHLSPILIPAAALIATSLIRED
jgi:lipid-binding SYLF domain-containing protein